jgi:prepilin-type N-terminal cleavage/methylation domain-containing protein
MGTNQPSTFANPRSSGFTLIELLIVLAIIGVLIGITFSGASYLFQAQQEKKALSDVEALKLALEEFKSENGDYPRTNRCFPPPDEKKNHIEGDEETLPPLTGKRLFLALSSFVDRHGDPYSNPENRPKAFIKSDVFSLGEKNGDEVEEVILDLSDSGNEPPECFVIDPWGNPYVYDYPRRDGNLGYLLFSKGSDGESSDFTKELISPESIDLDNLPIHEPGNW